MKAVCAGARHYIDGRPSRRTPLRRKRGSLYTRVVHKVDAYIVELGVVATDILVDRSVKIESICRSAHSIHYDIGCLTTRNVSHCIAIIRYHRSRQSAK